MERLPQSFLSRRTLLRRTSTIGATAALAAVAASVTHGAAHNDPPKAGESSVQGDNGCLDEAALAKLPDLQPLPPNGVEALIDLFDEHSLIAIGEDHGVWEIHDFLWSVLRHPNFPEKANNLVVEYGNSLYQDVIDRYVAGEDVPAQELRQVWRNTTQSVTLVWDSPIYEQAYAVVREINQQLPANKRVRVLLGDPPIDWRKVEKEEDVVAFLEQRDPHFTSVVEREVLDKGGRALMMAGALHFQRTPPPPADSGLPYHPSVIALLDERAPGQTFVLIPAGGAPVELDPDRTQLQRLATLPVPSIARVAGTWYGATGCLTIPTGDVLHVEDQVDGVAYLGPSDTFSVAMPSPFIYRDDEYFDELDRRHRIMRGAPLPLDEPRYVRHGTPGIDLRGGQADQGDMVSAAPDSGPPPAGEGQSTPAAES
ncbi:MAG: hypothetical protein M3121_00950 [Chloroflexota bacterium]|nr:hypothetical protein [Chloroflexota bacterium]